MIMTGAAADVVRAGWTAGWPLFAIAARVVVETGTRPLASGLGHRDVMDTVRALGLPDRDPVTRQVYPNTLAAADVFDVAGDRARETGDLVGALLAENVHRLSLSFAARATRPAGRIVLDNGDTPGCDMPAPVR